MLFHASDHVRLAAVPIYLLLKLSRQFFHGRPLPAGLVLYERVDFLAKLLILLDQRFLLFQLLA